MKHYKGYTNRECEFYPCHEMEDINCMFCCCPLYFTNCDGNFNMVKSQGKMIKDCTRCLYPHKFENYDDLMSRLTKEIYKNAKDISGNRS